MKGKCDRLFDVALWRLDLRFPMVLLSSTQDPIPALATQLIPEPVLGEGEDGP